MKIGLLPQTLNTQSQQKIVQTGLPSVTVFVILSPTRQPILSVFLIHFARIRLTLKMRRLQTSRDSLQWLTFAHHRVHRPLKFLQIILVRQLFWKIISILFLARLMWCRILTAASRIPAAVVAADSNKGDLRYGRVYL